MKIELKTNNCVITQEPGDTKYYGTANAAGESALLHAVKKQLNAAGHNLIKKRMWKDGHMMDDMQQYLRSKSKQAGIQIFNPRWAIEGANDALNRDGQVVLSVVAYP